MPHVLAWLGGLLIAAGIVALLPVLVLCLQVLLAVVAPRGAAAASGSSDRRARVAILMPAHNEALGVTEPLRSITAQLHGDDRVLVVADNCSDDTAAVAAALGAEVVERTDTTRRGKGFALDFGVRHLQADPPEVVIVVDADCQMAPGSIARLAHRCLQLGRPVQALYLMRSPPGAGLKTRMAELAWIVRNQVRPLGFAQLGLPCQLMGTGMAFPWEQLRTAQLATGNIVEDMQLGLDLAAAGHAPAFLPEALVTSVFPSTAEGIQAQRTRWEHGHLSVMASVAPRLLWRAIVGRRPALVAMVLDLCVPPLASLVLGLGALAVLTGVVWLFGGIATPLLLTAAAMLLLGLAIVAAWARFGRATVSLWELLSAPAYALRKIPMYLKLLGRRQMEWVRTKRDDAGT